MRLDPLEAGVAQIEPDKVGVAIVVERAPNRDGLGPEAAVREADDDRRVPPPEIWQRGIPILSPGRTS